MELLPRNDGGALENALEACCRLCRGDRSADPRRWSLFQEDLAGKLVSIAAVQIQENDGLPAIICTNCRDMVFMCYNFKCQVEKVDHDLRQALLMKQSATHWPTLPIVKPVENISSLETMTTCLQKNIISSSMTIPDDQAADNHEQFIFEISNSCIIESELCKNGNQVQFNNSIVSGSTEDNSNSTSISRNNSNNAEGAAFGNQQNNLNTQDNSKELDQENGNQSDDEKPLILRTKRHKCRHCIKSFANLTLLEKHAVVHKKSTEVVYVCYLCDEQFDSVDKVKEHASTSHDIIRNLKKAIENTKTQRVNGKRTDLNNKVENTCKVCSQQFTSYTVFINHMKCHVNCKDKLNGQNVQKSVESSCNSNGALTTLKTQNNNINNSRANSCRGSTDASDDDFSDDDQNEDEPEGNFECDQCGKIVSTLRNLRRHILTHSSLGHNCALCDKEFLSAKELKTHLHLRHKIDSELESLDENKVIPRKKRKKKNRPHKCPICPKAFAQAQSLVNHEERHRRAQDVHKRYLCEVCSKCFAQSGSLVAHMRTHTGVKPYVCNVCSRAFTKSTYLQLHLRTHSGEKPYVCQYCKRAFARANTLARHLTMHTGEAKYKCQICLKSFRRLTSLNEHTYTHTGQRPYACKICAKRYNNAGSLYAHTKKCKATSMKQQELDEFIAEHIHESIAEHFDESIAEQIDESIAEALIEPEPITAPVLTLQSTENIIPQNDNLSMPQVLIITDDKFNESLLGEVLTTDHATYQFMIANVQEKPMNTPNTFEPFVFQESDIYNMNQKQFKQPYYELYPSM